MNLRHLGVLGLLAVCALFVAACSREDRLSPEEYARRLQQIVDAAEAERYTSSPPWPKDPKDFDFRKYFLTDTSDEETRSYANEVRRLAELEPPVEFESEHDTFVARLRRLEEASRTLYRYLQALAAAVPVPDPDRASRDFDRLYREFLSASDAVSNACHSLQSVVRRSDPDLDLSCGPSLSVLDVIDDLP